MICGFEVEVVDPKPVPYKLVALFTFGKRLVIAAGHNPTVVREAESRVARNPKVIDRIVLEDLTGPLETIWSREWPEAGSRGSSRGSSR